MNNNLCHLKNICLESQKANNNGMQVDVDQNRQKSKKQFLKQKVDSFYSLNTVNKDVGKYEIKTGTMIPSILITEINSDLPGDVVAQVREMYMISKQENSVNPCGFEIIGKYDSSVTYGQDRVLLIWQRIVFPNGDTLVLENMQGVDLLGNADLKENK